MQLLLFLPVLLHVGVAQVCRDQDCRPGSYCRSDSDEPPNSCLGRLLDCTDFHRVNASVHAWWLQFRYEEDCEWLKCMNGYEESPTDKKCHPVPQAINCTTVFRKSLSETSSIQDCYNMACLDGYVESTEDHQCQPAPEPVDCTPLNRYKQSADKSKCLLEPPAAVNETLCLFFISGFFTLASVLACLVPLLVNMFRKLKRKEEKEDPEAGCLVNYRQGVEPGKHTCVELITQATNTNIEDKQMNQGEYKDSHVVGSIPSINDAEIFKEDSFGQV